jgi:hypothetical protein
MCKQDLSLSVFLVREMKKNEKMRTFKEQSIWVEYSKGKKIGPKKIELVKMTQPNKRSQVMPLKRVSIKASAALKRIIGPISQKIKNAIKKRNEENTAKKGKIRNAKKMREKEGKKEKEEMKEKELNDSRMELMQSFANSSFMSMKDIPVGELNDEEEEKREIVVKVRGFHALIDSSAHQ